VDVRQSPNATSRRRVLQFSLRWLLGGVTVTALLFGALRALGITLLGAAIGTIAVVLAFVAALALTAALASAADRDQ